MADEFACPIFAERGRKWNTSDNRIHETGNPVFARRGGERRSRSVPFVIMYLDIDWTSHDCCRL